MLRRKWRTSRRRERRATSGALQQLHRELKQQCGFPSPRQPNHQQTAFRSVEYLADFVSYYFIL